MLDIASQIGYKIYYNALVDIDKNKNSLSNISPRQLQKSILWKMAGFK